MRGKWSITQQGAQVPRNLSNSYRVFQSLLLSYGLFQSTYIPVICEITDAKHESLPLPVNIVES